jgi:hypothetical protein
MNKPASVVVTMAGGPVPLIDLYLCDDCYRHQYVNNDVTSYAHAAGYAVKESQSHILVPPKPCEWCAHPFDVERVKRLVKHSSRLQTGMVAYQVTLIDGETVRRCEYCAKQWHAAHAGSRLMPLEEVVRGEECSDCEAWE